MNQIEGKDVEEIGIIPKGLNSSLKVSIGTYRSWSFIYLQLFRKTDGEDGPGEMRGGLTMRSDTLADLLPVLGLALEKAEARNTGRRRK
jgi:hypothetical protein